jgi:exonuclease SbcD
MRILHTADVHLNSLQDERWQTLTELLQIGQAEKIDLFIICGDLFDSDSASEELRPHIRSLFTGNGFSIVILPGNHDHRSYGEGKYFGEDVHVIQDPLDALTFGDVVIRGLPFEPTSEKELLHRLRRMKSSLDVDKQNILLFHGELLDSFYSREDFGREGNERSMPVRLASFEGIPLAYILAGHFHSKFDIRLLPGGGYFVYPGSPVSVTRKETGRRRVNLFDVGSSPVERILDSPHYQGVDVELDPMDDRDPVLVVTEHLGACHPRARVLLTVRGYVNSRTGGLDEGELVGRMDSLLRERCAEIAYLFRDIGSVLEDELYREFLEALGKRGHDEQRRQRLVNVALRAMMEAEL